MHLESHIGISAAPEGGGLHLQDSGVKLDLTEKTLALNADGSAKMQFTYNDLRPTDEDTDYQFREMMGGVLEGSQGILFGHGLASYTDGRPCWRVDLRA